jgi:hypothetical protein
VLHLNNLLKEIHKQNSHLLAQHLIIKNRYTERHGNPTDGLVSVTRSQTYWTWLPHKAVFFYTVKERLKKECKAIKSMADINCFLAL